jgi:hypothetical protein
MDERVDARGETSGKDINLILANRQRGTIIGLNGMVISGEIKVNRLKKQQIIFKTLIRDR